MPDYGVTEEQVAAAAGILRPNGFDIPAATLERALAAAMDAERPRNLCCGTPWSCDHEPGR